MNAKELAKAVTFIPNLREPIHNWFYFKEGFSKELVKFLIKEFNLEQPIFDPCCGVGTTLLVAKEINLKSIGIDINPLMVFISRAKTNNYNIDELKQIFREFSSLKPTFVGRFENKKICKLFYGKTIDDIYFYYKKIANVSDEKAKDFLLLALIDTAIKVANVIKVGGSLRKVKKPRIPVRKLFIRKIKRMINDLERTKLSKQEPIILEKDIRNFRLEENSVGSIITSPPYLNKIEYTTVYKLELGLFFDYPETKLRAYISNQANNQTFDIIDAKYPTIANAYFSDMKKVLENLYYCLKNEGILCMVVAGGCFYDSVIESDEIIANIAKNIGFKLIKIMPARRIICHRQRTIKIGTVRESIIILKK